MKINDKFEIKKGEIGFIVIEKIPGINPKTGKEYNGQQTYHATMLQACKYLVNNNIITQDVATVVNCINQSTRDIVKVLEQHGVPDEKKSES